MDNPANRGDSGGGRPFADICVVAHVDNDTGELIAELADGTRLPKPVLEELACNARFTGVVYGHKGKPIWRTEAQRGATEAQRRILLDRWGGCFHCGANPGLCQTHHIEPVSEGGETKLDNLVPSCWDCHHRIHYDHWWILKSPDGWHTLHPPQRVHHGPARAPDHATPPQPFKLEPPTAPDPPAPASPTLFAGGSQPDPPPTRHPATPAALTAPRSEAAKPGPQTARAALRRARAARHDPEHAPPTKRAPPNTGSMP